MLQSHKELSGSGVSQEPVPAQRWGTLLLPLEALDSSQGREPVKAILRTRRKADTGEKSHACSQT